MRITLLTDVFLDLGGTKPSTDTSEIRSIANNANVNNGYLKKKNFKAVSLEQFIRNCDECYKRWHHLGDIWSNLIIALRRTTSFFDRREHSLLTADVEDEAFQRSYCSVRIISCEDSISPDMGSRSTQVLYLHLRIRFRGNSKRVILTRDWCSSEQTIYRLLLHFRRCLLALHHRTAGFIPTMPPLPPRT